MGVLGWLKVQSLACLAQLLLVLPSRWLWVVSSMLVAAEPLTIVEVQRLP